MSKSLKKQILVLLGILTMTNIDSFAEDNFLGNSEYGYNSHPWSSVSQMDSNTSYENIEQREKIAKSKLKSYAGSQIMDVVEDNQVYQKTKRVCRNFVEEYLTLRIGDVPSNGVSDSSKDLSQGTSESKNFGEKNGRFLKINFLEAQAANPDHIRVKGELKGKKYGIDITSPWKPFKVPLPKLEVEYDLLDNEIDGFVGYEFSF